MESRKDLKVVSNMDLNKSIQTFNHIVTLTERLTGEQTHPFTDSLQPVLDQVSASGVHAEHSSLVAFSLTTGEAHKAASKMPLRSISFEEMISSIKNVCLDD